KMSVSGSAAHVEQSVQTAQQAPGGLGMVKVGRHKPAPLERGHFSISLLAGKTPAIDHAEQAIEHRNGKCLADPWSQIERDGESSRELIAGNRKRLRQSLRQLRAVRDFAERG